MRPLRLQDKHEIERLLRDDDVYLHLYEIGDLDQPFWPHSIYYTTPGEGQRPVVLLYTGLSLPCLLALTKTTAPLMKNLVESVIASLPEKVYAHLSEGLRSLFEKDFRIESHGSFLKMGLLDTARLKTVDTALVRPLSPEDVCALKGLYDQSYPGHWFEPHMLQSGYYYGIWIDSSLVSAAGVHVYSKAYKVAAIGNIATHLEFRGQGFARAVCARLCLELLPSVQHIGLNVNADNASAVYCYQQLGFAPVAQYGEHLLERRSS
jgi:ribosomal protein S18 acetylase RimI-like enzyme